MNLMDINLEVYLYVYTLLGKGFTLIPRQV